MNKSEQDILSSVKTQSAAALVSAVFEFLGKNGFTKKAILMMAKEQVQLRPKANLKKFRHFIRAYEEMGMIMSMWYTNPQFLNEHGEPLCLSRMRGPRSIRNLIRLSDVRLSLLQALELMHLSPSVAFDVNGRATPIRRVFVLPDFEIPRAALIVARFLETLQKNSSTKSGDAKALLERSCHVSKLDSKRANLVLRDIKERGTAFMDSVDGEIEGRRCTSLTASGGEIGVLTFAWTRNLK